MFTVSASKAIFQNPQSIPAKDNWPAKTQVKVSTGKGEFYLSSSVVDLMKVPDMEPVSFTAECSRVSGGKGFYVFDVQSFNVQSIKKG